MAKVRVYELAKELGLESKELLSTLNEMGEFVRSASSTIEAPVVRRVTEKVKGVHKDAKSGAVDHAPAPKKSGAPAPKPKTSATPQTPQPDAPQAAAGAKVGPRATPGPHPVPGPRAVPGPRPTKVDRPPRASPLSSGRIPSPVSVASRSRAPHRRNPRAVPVRLRDRAGLRLPVVPAPVRPLRVHVRVRHRRTCVVRELRVRATTRSRRRRGWARPVVPPSRVPVAAMVALPVRVRAVRRVPAAATGCRVRIPR